MKKLMMVLPLAILLAYCSGPNNTQTTTDTDMDANTSASVSTTTDDLGTTASSDITASTTTTTDNTNTSTSADISVSGTTTVDMSDPMNQHFERANGENWTWDMDYPGYDRPTTGTYNSAINGNWQLVMTPELVTAWRQDDSRSLWMNQQDTYLSASESFNTNTDVNGTASVNGNVNMNGTLDGSATANGTVSPVYNDAATMPQTTTQGNTTNIGTTTDKSTQGSVNVNGSTSAGTVASGTNAAQHGVTNKASGNAAVANQMNGNTTNTSVDPVYNDAATMPQTTTSGNVGVSGSVNANTGTTGVTGSTSVDNTTGMNMNATGTMDVNSINYNAANGNMYQMPQFNLYLDNGSFTGYTGCNGISGRVELTGTSLRFLNTNTSTAIDCMGGLDESALLDMLKRVDSYAYVGDELQLMQGSQVLLKFRKNNNQDTTLK